MSSRQADFVIVGGGSAGCVLAARLSEDPAAQVVLLEAGGPGDAEDIRIPGCSRNLFLSEHDWAFYSEPEPALKGRRVYQPRGRALGGSSATNMMVYMRGSAADYDEDRKSTRLNSSHLVISYAVFCLKKKNTS